MSLGKFKRKYLNHDEITLLLDAIKDSSLAPRDKCMIYLSYIHGLRVSELTGLMISDLDLTTGNVFIRRLKRGMSTQQPLTQIEKKLLRDWLSIRNTMVGDRCPWLFVTKDGERMSRQRFYYIIRQLGKKAKLSVSVHPHMLRHSCGYTLANHGADTRLIQDYLGHRNIRHTVLYTAANANRFGRLWRVGKKTF
jgi:type 1 fimbriae regulatory protein FimB